MKDEMARDKGIEKLVARKLREQASAPGANCLDAETLAAYVERTLIPGERLSCEAHLSSCSLCQEQVAQLVRASEGEVGLSGAASPSRAGLLGFRWSWAAPAFVAVIIAGLWYTGEFRPLLRMRQEAPIPTPPAPALTRLPSPMGEGTGGGVKPPAKAERQQKELPLAAAREKVKTPPASASRATGTGRGAAVGEAVTPLNENRPVAGPAAAPAVIAMPSERARLAGTGLRRDLGPVVPRTRDEAQEAPAPTAGAAAPSLPKAMDKLQAPRSAAAGETKSEAPGKRAALFAAANSFPPVASNWRVGPHGLIEKRTHEGNWMAVESGVEVDLFAITFSTPAIGWAVGAGGTVLRTTDGGATWNKLAFPIPNDLVRVVALSDQVARVDTRAGQSFHTSNGGKSWKRTH